MKLLDRLSNLIRSNLNAAIDSVSDPGKEIDLLVEQMEDEQRAARVQLRDAIAQEKLRQKRAEEAYRNVQRWQEHAERAVSANEDELAKEALRRMQDAERTLEEEERHIGEQSRHVQRLTEQIKRNDDKLAQIKARKETLKAQARQVKQTQSSEGDAFSRFDRLADQIEMNEHQAAAMADMANDDMQSRDQRTEEKFARLLPQAQGALVSAEGDAIDARLAALKAKLDKRGEGA